MKKSLTPIDSIGLVTEVKLERENEKIPIVTRSQNDVKVHSSQTDLQNSNYNSSDPINTNSPDGWLQSPLSHSEYLPPSPRSNSFASISSAVTSHMIMVETAENPNFIADHMDSVSISGGSDTELVRDHRSKRYVFKSQQTIDNSWFDQPNGSNSNSIHNINNTNVRSHSTIVSPNNGYSGRHHGSHGSASGITAEIFDHRGSNSNHDISSYSISHQLRSKESPSQNNGNHNRSKSSPSAATTTSNYIPNQSNNVSTDSNHNHHEITSSYDGHHDDNDDDNDNGDKTTDHSNSDSYNLADLLQYNQYRKTNLPIDHFCFDDKIAQITDCIFLGDIRSGHDEPLLCRLRIESMVDMSNLLPEDVPRSKIRDIPCMCPSPYKHTRLRLNIQVRDSTDEDLMPYLEDINGFIEANRRRNKRVLIFCYSGKSSSPTAVIQYLMHHNSMRLQQAYDHVKRRFPTIKINRGFWQTLQRLDERLHSTSNKK